MTHPARLGGMTAWFNWLLAVSFVVLVFTLQTGYAVTNIGMKQEMGLSVAQVGFIGSIYTWVFAITQFGSGSMLDRLGMRWLLPSACGLVSIGGIIFSMAPNAEVLVLGQFFMAAGASFGFIGAGFVGGQWFAPSKYSIMFTWVQFAASISAILGQQALAIAVRDFDWRIIILCMALGGVVITLLMFLFMRESHRPEMERKPWPGFKKFFEELFDSVNEVAAVRDAWVNALIGGATFGSMLALGVVWGPRFLIAAGMEIGDAYSVSAMMWLGLALGAPCFGWLSDRVKKRKWPMAMGCFLQLIAILFIIFDSGMDQSTATVTFFLWGFFAGGSMLNFPIGAELVRPSLIGTSAAVVNAVQFIVGGLIMAIPGRVLSGTGLIAHFAEIEMSEAPTVSDYQWALLVIPLVLLMALLLFMFLKETYPSEEELLAEEAPA